MLCFSIVLWLRRLGNQLLKAGGCGGSAAEDVAKICTSLWREGDLEVNIIEY